MKKDGKNKNKFMSSLAHSSLSSFFLQGNTTPSCWDLPAKIALIPGAKDLVMPMHPPHPQGGNEHRSLGSQHHLR
jgi:hypothetical protein